MMIFKKAIPRRTFFRGVGASLAIQLLESMIPAFAAGEGSAAQQLQGRPTRLAFAYVPNGIIMDKWTPATVGSAFEMTPILEPLTPFRDQLLVLSGLDDIPARGLPGEPVGEHPRASGAYLTGIHPKPTGGADVVAGISLDQIVADEFQKYTQLGSLELGIESSEIVGACNGFYSCAYENTIAWRNATTPLPAENDPRVVFEKLFGDSDTTDRAGQLSRLQERRSVLDFVSHDVARLLSDVGPSDRIKVDQYTDAIRDIERRIEKAEEQSSAQEVPTFQRPTGVSATFTEHIKLLLDLLVLAYQSDLTRVSTFMIGHEMSAQPYPDLGIWDPYHPLTHHQGDPEKIAKDVRINTFHVQMLAYFLDKLRSTPEGDGSLLDHSIIVYGAGLSDGNLHLCTNLPTLMVGGGSGRIKGGRHLQYPKGTPLTNLYVTLLDKLGIPVEKFGDSNGELNLLPV